MPFWLLYRLSDCLYFILLYVLKYRKNVILDNLRNSFPEKSEKEIQKILKSYYQYFCDLVLETFKSLTISKKEALKRFQIPDKTLFEELYSQNKSLVVIMGHYSNWEWASTTSSLIISYPIYVIYRPLSNKYFGDLINKMRSRFGTKMVSMAQTFRQMIQNKDTPTITVFVGDQTPFREHAYWTDFLNQETGVFIGTEKMARKFNYPVLFATIKRVKRGYYHFLYEMLCENPASTPEGELTKMHTKRLEKEIKAQPELWLWSHRRWKYKREASDEKPKA